MCVTETLQQLVIACETQEAGSVTELVLWLFTEKAAGVLGCCRFYLNGEGVQIKATVEGTSNPCLQGLAVLAGSCG